MTEKLTHDCTALVELGAGQDSQIQAVIEEEGLNVEEVIDGGDQVSVPLDQHEHIATQETVQIAKRLERPVGRPRGAQNAKHPLFPPLVLASDKEEHFRSG